MKIYLLAVLFISVSASATEICIDCHNKDATNGSLKASGLHEFSGELGAKTISRRAPASYDDEAERLYWKWKAEWRAETEDLQKLVVETGIEILDGKRKDIKFPRDDIEIKARYEALIALNKKMKDLLEKGVYEGGVVYQPLMKTFAGKDRFDTYEAQTVLNQVDLWFFEENFKYNNSYVYNFSEKDSVFLIGTGGERKEYTSDSIIGLVNTIITTDNPTVYFNGLKALASLFYDPKNSEHNAILLYGFGGQKMQGGVTIPKKDVDDPRAVMYGYRAARSGDSDVMGFLAKYGDEFKVESYPELFKFGMVSSLSSDREGVELFRDKRKDGSPVVDVVFKNFNDPMFKIAKKNNFFQDLNDEYKWISIFNRKLKIEE